jgi:hypothetical protein
MGPMPFHLEAILDLARWAPSGDNTQPWRFEILGDEHVLVHGLDTRDHVVYDLDGHASQLAVGALLETLSIAASARQRRMAISRRSDTPDSHLLFDIRFQRDESLLPDPLVESIEKRVVQRRAMSMRPLTAAEKSTLEQSLPAGYQVRWFETFAQRWTLAWFMFDNAKIRLLIPEAFAVHREVIEWGARYSQNRIPEQAVGVDAMTARLMRWAMASWPRLRFLNTYLLGHLPPRVQLDLIPGLFCSAHYALLAPKPLVEIDEYIAAGRAMQSFWLNATRLGLLIQPEMTPVIFTRYHRQGRRFTQVNEAEAMAGRLNERLAVLLDGHSADKLIFMGRLGERPHPWSRSTRKDLGDLIAGGPSGHGSVFTGNE